MKLPLGEQEKKYFIFDAYIIFKRKIHVCIDCGLKICVILKWMWLKKVLK